MAAYYNEIDPYAAQWLRNLIGKNLIAPGDVDERSIVDVRASDLAGYAQCHFFAGIGIWSAALRQAGWPDDRPVWTGSCPCQPLSAAGKRLGAEDNRHLWPDWFKLIEQHRPIAIFGEQVASKDGLAWLDIVQSDLENASYASGAVDLCAAGVGAPHIRQRLWFVGVANGAGSFPWRQTCAPVGQGNTTVAASGARQLAHADQGQRRRLEPSGLRVAGELADTLPAGRPERRPSAGDGQIARSCGAGELANTSDTGSSRTGSYAQHEGSFVEPRDGRREDSAPGPVNGFWRDAEWIACTDGKARPAKPGIFPLVNGYPNRVGILRAAGNAINKEAAAEFIAAARIVQ